MIKAMQTKSVSSVHVPTVAYQGARQKARPKRWYRRWPVWTVAALVVCGLGTTGILMHRAGAAPGSSQNGADIEPVTLGTVVKSVTSAGTVTANVDVDIKCQASGPIAKLPIEVSQMVKAGDLLFQLDPIDEQLQVKVAQENVDQADAKEHQAELAYQDAALNLETTRAKVQSALTAAKVKAANLQSKADRQKQLVAQKLGSSEDYETAETDAAAAADAAVSAQVAVDQLKQQEIELAMKKFDIATAKSVLAQNNFNLSTANRLLGYTTVLSPIDGIVTGLGSQISVGSQVQSGTGGFSGGTTILSLADRSHVFVVATVDQSDFGGIEPSGQKALIKVDSYPNRSFDGVVVSRAPEGNVASNVVTFQVKIEVTDKDKEKLWPAMTGTVTIIEARRDNVVMVPNGAVIRRQGKTLVKTADGAERAVTLGLEGTDTTEVLSGLKAGDRVMVQAQELPSKWKSTSGGPGGPPPK
jgi:HlyD family secretion protein